MNTSFRATIELHIAVLLFGFTAILGELITLHPLLLTFWRVLIASSAFLIFFLPTLRRAHLPRRLWVTFGLVGILVAIHWLTFYASIKASHPSLTLVCLATTTFFTAFTEPLLLGHRVSKLQISVGLLVIPGMAIIMQSQGAAYAEGILLGITSAIFSALFGSLNKKYLKQNDPIAVSFIQMTSATLVLGLCLPFFIGDLLSEDIYPSTLDWVYLLILGLLCTNVAYLLAMRALRYLSAYHTALTINLEPIYGILLAAFLLHQHRLLDTGFYIGTIIILFAVFSYPVLDRIAKRADKS